MLREIFYRQFADIRPNEWPRALLLSLFFFLIIATYWILKPVKRGLIINHFQENPLSLLGFTFSGAQAEQFGKVLNLLAVYLVVVLFVHLSRRVARHHLVQIFALGFAAAFVLYSRMIHSGSDLMVWSFYVLGDMFNTAMVAIFWAFTGDIVHSAEAKRTFGLIGFGGVLGGFLGATLVSSTVEDIGRATLLAICVGPMVIISGLAHWVHRRAATANRDPEDAPAASESRQSAALEGARLVAGSKYLLAIAGLIASYELVSNIIDFQLSATVEQTIPHSLGRDAFFGRVGQIIGVISIVVQLFLTSFVLKRFGVRMALSFLPVAILVTTAGFLIVPMLVFAASMSVADNSLNYSINQSAREALYVPTSKDAKYKAKAFIDMFVQRLAKVVSVLLNLVFSVAFVSGVRWLSLVTLAMLAGWFVLVRYLGRGFKKAEERRAMEDAQVAERDARSAYGEEARALERKNDGRH